MWDFNIFDANMIIMFNAINITSKLRNWVANQSIDFFTVIRLNAQWKGPWCMQILFVCRILDNFYLNKISFMHICSFSIISSVGFRLCDHPLDAFMTLIAINYSCEWSAYANNSMWEHFEIDSPAQIFSSLDRCFLFLKISDLCGFMEKKR